MNDAQILERLRALPPRPRQPSAMRRVREDRDDRELSLGRARGTALHLLRHGARRERQVRPGCERLHAALLRSVGGAAHTDARIEDSQMVLLMTPQEKTWQT